MSTKQTLIDQITDDLDRSDLTDQVVAAIDTAIRFYENERFWFNTSYSQTATLSSSSAMISMSALPKQYFEIDRVRYVESASMKWALEPDTYDAIMMDQDIPVYAIPDRWCVYAGGLQFDSYAADDYTLVIDGLVSLADTVTSNSYSVASTAAWFNDARNLIRAAAKKDLFMHVIKDGDQALGQAEMEKGAYKMLKGKTNQRASTGYVKATDF